MKKEADTCRDGFDVDDIDGSGSNNKEERDYFSLKRKEGSETWVWPRQPT